MHKTQNQRKRDISSICISDCQLWIGRVNLFDSDKAAAESVAHLIWQDFIKPQLFQKGKWAVLVLLSAPPKICCLRPNRHRGTRDSWAVRDAANPDLSRWTCEKLQLSAERLEEENDVLSVLSCCPQGVSKLSATLKGVRICNTFQPFMGGMRMQPLGACMEGLLLKQDVG